MEENGIRLGRITSEAEKTLGISFTSDVGIYADQVSLDRMARAHPDSYLSLLEKAKKVIRTPDFVRSIDKDSIELAQIQYAGEEFIPYVVLIEREGTPGFWYLKRLYRFDRGGRDKKGPLFLRVKAKGRKRDSVQEDVFAGDKGPPE